jgi:hypothetical protein
VRPRDPAIYAAIAATYIGLAVGVALMQDTGYLVILCTLASFAAVQELCRPAPRRQAIIFGIVARGRNRAVCMGCGRPMRKPRGYRGQNEDLRCPACRQAREDSNNEEQARTR